MTPLGMSHSISGIQMIISQGLTASDSNFPEICFNFILKIRDKKVNPESFFPIMNILELPKKDEAEVVPFKQIETAESLDNIFADIANEANMTIGEAKRKIEIHGSSPILAIKNFLLGILRF